MVPIARHVDLLFVVVGEDWPQPWLRVRGRSQSRLVLAEMRGYGYILSILIIPETILFTSLNVESLPNETRIVPSA